MVMAAAVKRNYLPLKKKVELIKHAQTHPGTNIRELAELFECGKTQVAQILKKKEELLAMYESNASGSRVHTASRPSEYSEVNKALYEWYKIACSKNIYPGGPQLTEKAKQIAEQLGKSNFTGSRGWLDKWKKRYNIKKLKVCGESGDVSGETVQSWKERLPEILSKYSKEDIWNIDESGVFWQALPESGFAQKGRQCHGGKKSKKRVTVAFFVSASGWKDPKPIIIWKSENPRCFKKCNKSDLPVTYFSQKKAWMTGEIMNDILTKLNRQLSRNGRHILLLMDNAGCHPEDLTTKFSNIKICFLPPNTTSKLQPLDLGIIQNFKLHYRKLFLRYVLSKIDECETASDVVKSVDVLTAIRWVSMAWSCVKEDTISKCFWKAGILDSSFDVVRCPHTASDGDPFLEADATFREVQSLIEQTMPTEGCSVEEYLKGDDDLPICTDLDSDTWDANFMSELAAGDSQDTSEDEDVTDGSTLQPPVPVIKSFKEAMKSLEDVEHFLQSQGHMEEALVLGSSVDRIARMQLQSTTQTTINDYFSQ